MFSGDRGELGVIRIAEEIVCREPDLLDVAGEQSGADDPGDPGFEGSHGPPGLSTPKGFERDNGHDGLPGVSGMSKNDRPFGIEGRELDSGT